MDTRSIETLTDPYEPFKEEYMKTLRERDTLHNRLQESAKQFQEMGSKVYNLEIRSNVCNIYNRGVQLRDTVKCM